MTVHAILEFFVIIQDYPGLGRPAQKAGPGIVLRLLVTPMRRFQVILELLQLTAQAANAGAGGTIPVLDHPVVTAFFDNTMSRA